MAQAYPYLNSPAPLAFAHRGGWLHDDGGRLRDELENTVAAFQNAIDMGYRYLETDVHATRDGVLLAFHDSTLDRATDQRGVIADLPYTALARARIGGQEPIPVMEELLGSWPHARFNIDIKAHSAVEPLARVLRRTNAWDRVCVGSFDQTRLTVARRFFDRAVCMSAGPRDIARLRFASYTRALIWLARSGVACAQVPPRVGRFPLLSRDFIATAHRLGMHVHVWTVNDPALMDRLLDFGADGIITDNISGLRDVLITRGAWHNAGYDPQDNRAD